MPIIKAAAKALRQTKIRALKNLKIKSDLDLLQRRLKKAFVAKQLEEVKKLTVLVQKALDKAAKVHIISKNKSARLKSKIMRQMIA